MVNCSFFYRKVKKLQLTTQENKKKKTAVDQWSTAVSLSALHSFPLVFHWFALVQIELFSSPSSVDSTFPHIITSSSTMLFGSQLLNCSHPIITGTSAHFLTSFPLALVCLIVIHGCSFLGRFHIRSPTVSER